MDEMASGEEIDFAVAAYREEGSWQLDPLPRKVAGEFGTLVSVLRQRPADGGALGLVSVDEDFFLLVRVLGDDVRVLLSDATAALDWPLAREAVEQLPDEVPTDVDSVQPAGDLDIVADLGVDALSLGMICADFDRYPDEMLGEVADRIGFGERFEQALDAVLGRTPGPDA